MVSVLS